MKIKIRTAVLIAVLVIALIVAGLQIWNGGTISLEHGEEICWHRGLLYVLEQRDGAYRVLCADEAGNLQAAVELPESKKDTYIRYGSLHADQGQVYLVAIERDLNSDLTLAETVYRVDLTGRKLVQMWQLEVLDPTQVTNLCVQVRGGVLTYFRGMYRGKEAVGRLYRWKQGAQPVEVASFSHDIGEGFTDFYYASCGTIAFSTPGGVIYTCKAELNAEITRVYPEEELEGGLTVFAGDGRNALYVAGADGMLHRLDMTGAYNAERLFGLDVRTGWIQQEIGQVDFDTDETFVALRKNGSELKVFRDSERLTLRRLTSPAMGRWPQALLGFAGVWLAAGLLWLLRRGFYLLTKGKLPVVTKLLAVFLPVLVGSMLMMNTMVTGFFTERMVQEQYEKLYLLTAQQVSGMDTSYISRISTRDPFDDLYFYELRSGLNVLPKQGTLHDAEDMDEVYEAYNSAYFWLYKLDGTTLKTLICEQDYVGIPVELKYSDDIAREFYRVVQSKKTLTTQFHDEMGTWTVLLSPILDDTGKVVAVLETGDTKQALDHSVAEGVRELSKVTLTAMAVLTLLLSGVIVYSLQPLSDLKVRVLEISDGKLGVQAPERSNDEITEIIRAFNTMSRNVAIRDTEIRQTNKGYSRFVPERVFALLEKSSVIDVQLADQTSVMATVLNCSVSSFDDLARNMRSKEMFRFINRVLDRLVPVVDETGGLVDGFNKAGLMAVYTHQPEKALDAAVTLCQTIRNLQEQEGQWDADFHVTLSAGSAMIGIVGARERLEAVTISEHTSFSGFLQKVALEQGASILMAASAAEGIADFASRYHVRTIGFVYMKSMDRAERLYDVYDGDDDTTRRLKDETREAFEKGVALYYAREYYEARLLFIQVLKKNRYDKAAKNYLYLCDTYYRQEGGAQQEVWLEVY